MLHDFTEFCAALARDGFSMGGSNARGIYTLLPFAWNEPPPVDCPLRWHTGDVETDPWEWRMRVLEQRDDIAYAKVFFGAAGYIHKTWYPQFLAVRRGGESFAEVYEAGKAGVVARRLYDAIAAGPMPLHELKRVAGAINSTQFAGALTWLQMHMFITICGRVQKRGKYGEGYGWNSTVFTTVEDFWMQRKTMLPLLSAQDSYAAIRQQVYRLHPQAAAKTVDKFILG